MLLAGCVGTLLYCMAATSPTRFGGPMNWSPIGSGWYYGLCIVLFVMTVLLPMLWLCRDSVVAGVICITSGVLLFAIMMVRFENLNQDSFHDYEYGPAEPAEYWSCAMPATLLLAAGVFRISNTNKKVYHSAGEY